MISGSSKITISCWRPTGSMRDEVASFFMGNTANLTNDDIVCGKAAWKSRCRLVTIPTGKVCTIMTWKIRQAQLNLGASQPQYLPALFSGEYNGSILRKARRDFTLQQ